MENKKENHAELKERIPKRILHFSDGSVPEYSSSSDEEDSVDNAVTTVDASSLGWPEWLLFKTSELGNSVLNICDYLGESLSSFFGITTPKYQFEIDHYNMMKKLEEEMVDAETGASMSSKPITEQPTSQKH